jgi:hypothetical protein
MIPGLLFGEKLIKQANSTNIFISTFKFQGFIDGFGSVAVL